MKTRLAMILSAGALVATAAVAAPDPQAQVEQRITSLHSRLHITAAEEPDWQAFTAVMKQNAAEQAAAMNAREQKFASMNAVQDLQSFADVTQQQAQAISKLVGPFQTLYAAFSPEQKLTADEIFHNYTARAAQRHG